MKHSEFDLLDFLLRKIYDHMSDEDVRDWDHSEAAALAHDLRMYDGIDCDPDELFEIISEFVQQDAQG
jgi:hypothetical protein